MFERRSLRRTLWAPAPAKAAFRALLYERVARQGFTAQAIDTLVEHSQITYWRANQQIFTPGEAQDLTNFVIAGAVKVVCRGHRDVPVVVQVVKPGRWFGAAWFFNGPERREFAAVAHVPSIVAMVSQDVMQNVLAGMPPGNVLRLIAYTWRVFSRLLLERCLFLTMSLEERVAYALAVLARDFGRQDAGGTLVDLPLRHADLAQFVVATETNVSRRMAALRRARLIDRVGPRVLVAKQLLESAMEPEGKGPQEESCD